MPPEFGQMIYNVPIFKCFFPALDNLTFADITQHLISSLDRLQLVPEHIAVWGNKIGQPLKQNIITVNQENIDHYTKQNTHIVSQETSSSKRNLKKLKKTKTTYIISSHNLQHRDEGLRERHLNHVVPREQRHPQLRHQPMKFGHFTGTQEIIPYSSVLSHWR